MDYRVRYTKMILNETLIKYLEDKPLEKITVTQICKDAKINRSTYYSHYDNPFDQFAKLKAEVLSELTDYVNSLQKKKNLTLNYQYEIFRGILQYIKEKKHIFQILLSKNGDYTLQHELLSLLGEKALTQKSETDDTSPEHQYHMIYISNGCYGMVYEWLMNDCNLSYQELARMMGTFVG